MSMRRDPASGFTLLEIIIVIALVSFVYTIAIPNFNLKTGTEVAATLGRLNADIRAAYDFAILSGKPCRLVFKLYTGEYWLETTDAQSVYLGDRKVLNDPLKFEEDDRLAEFENSFEQYKELAEQSFTDPATDAQVTTSSPVLEAKDKLKGPKWYKYESLEWGNRSLGEALAFRSIRAEHHERAITVEDVGEEALAFVYFLPQGYVEKAVFYIYYRLDERSLDMETNPYRIITRPHQGEAHIDVVAKESVDINELSEGDNV